MPLPMERIRVKVVGERGVGKRSLMHALVHGTYESDIATECEVAVELPSGKRLVMCTVRCARRLMRRCAANLATGAG